MNGARAFPTDILGRTPGLARMTVRELCGSAATRSGAGLLIAAGALGLLAAVIVAITAPTSDRTFAQISFAVQSAISLPLPFVSVLLMTRDFGRRGGARTSGLVGPVIPVVAAKWLASAVIAVLAAGYGTLLSVVATSLLAGSAPEGRWQATGMVLLGSVLVQLVAQLCGAGFGLLLRSSALAIVADVVVPLGLWILTGAVAGLQGVQAWLTPFESVRHLLSGQMDGQRWAQLAVVVLIWDVALNATGVLRLLRGAASHSVRPGRRERDHRRRVE